MSKPKSMGGFESVERTVIKFDYETERGFEMYTSLQRWIYVTEETLPDALRALADALEAVRPEPGEWLDDDPTVVTLTMDVETGVVIAGICVGYRNVEES